MRADRAARRLVHAAAALLLLAAAVAGCKEKGDEAGPTLPSARKLEIVPGPGEGSVAAAVHAESARARSRGRQVLVYVGAHWCDPCQHFKAAAKAGKLDAVFPQLTLMEFDYDRDKGRLEEAGYASRMIPLFAVPRADGHASGASIAGSIKGEGAVDEITPRLRKLLDDARRAP